MSGETMRVIEQHETIWKQIRRETMELVERFECIRRFTRTIKLRRFPNRLSIVDLVDFFSLL